MAPESKKRSVRTVTVLFTDIVGSTESLDRLGDDAADRARRGHFKSLRQVVHSFGGTEIKSLGDGLMVAFSSASDAAACAVAIQQAAAGEADSPPVRIGLHTGEAAWEEDDLYGAPVVVARRLCDKASANQILVSDLVRGLIGRRGNFSFNDLGFLELKGFRNPVAAVEVLWRPHPTKLIESNFAQSEVPHRSNRGALIGIGSAVIVAVLAVILILAGRKDSPGSTEPTSSGGGSNSALRSLSLQWAVEDLGTLAEGSGEQIMLDLTVHRGRLLAPGYDGLTGDRQAVLWIRGRRGGWSKVYPDGSKGTPGDQTIFAVEGRGRTLVAVGSDNASGNWDAATWTSNDLGRRWRRTDSVLHEPGDEEIFSVADDGSRFVAVGYAAEAPREYDVAIWSSRDGRAWSRVTDSKGAFAEPGQSIARDVLATENGFIAVGREEISLPEHGSDAAVWRSATVGVWEAVENRSSARPRNQGIMSIVPWRDGFLAGGYDSVVGNMDAALWGSLDGATWERIPTDESVFGGPNDQIILALDVKQGLLTAAGIDGIDGGEDAAVWLSFSGMQWRRMPSDENVLGGDGVQSIRGVMFDGRGILGAGGTQESGDWDGRVWRAPLEGL